MSTDRTAISRMSKLELQAEVARLLAALQNAKQTMGETDHQRDTLQAAINGNWKRWRELTGKES